MVLIFHFLFGAAIITKISNIPLAFLLAILSHYFLDFLPHRDLYSIENIKQRRWRKSFFDFSKIFLDISLGVLFLLIISKKIILPFIGGVLATIPDMLTFLYILFPQNKFLSSYNDFHKNKVQFLEKKKIPLFWRLFNQFIILVWSILLLIS